MWAFPFLATVTLLILLALSPEELPPTAGADCEGGDLVLMTVDQWTSAFEWCQVEPAGVVSCGPAAGRMLPVSRRFLPVEKVLPYFSVLATGYSSTTDQTDDTPFVTATNRPVRSGIVALSRDLLREFTPHAPFGYGDEIMIPGVGRFVVEDTMHRRWRNRIDIWFPTREKAVRWGIRPVSIVPA